MVEFPEVLPTHTPALFDRAVERAVALLQAGEVIGLPTETVYGLAANALNAEAVARIYAIKGRPEYNPIIVHVASLVLAKSCAADWPEAATRLAEAFWPGPLTLVLPKSHSIPPIVTAGGGTVGIRWPSHPFMQAVIRRGGFPIAAPSANLSNQLSPTNAVHVQSGLGNRIPMIVDGGQCQVGIESTVVDLTGPTARILRPGMIDASAIQRVLSAPSPSDPRSSAKPSPTPDPSTFPAPSSESQTLKSPGQLPKHYAPKARLLVLSWNSQAAFQRLLHDHAAGCHRVHAVAYQVIPNSLPEDRVSVIPDDPEAYARALYSELHRCDDEGADLILVEAVPDTPEWHGIADRLKRAATPEPAESPSSSSPI